MKKLIRGKTCVADFIPPVNGEHQGNYSKQVNGLNMLKLTKYVIPY